MQGLAEVFSPFPEPGQRMFSRTPQNIIRRCSRCSRGERKFHLKHVPVFQTRCNHSAKNNIKCRFSLCWRAAAREAITYWNLLVIHIVSAEELAFILICVHIFTVKPTLKIQFLYIFLQFWLHLPSSALMTAFFFFFQSVVPVTAGFLFPLTDLDDISAERRGSLCLNGAFLIWTSLLRVAALWALLASGLLGGVGGEVPGKETRHTWSFYLTTGLKTPGRSAEPWGRSHTCLTPWQRKTARRVCIRFIHTRREECCFFWRVSTANKSETSQV